MLSAGKSLPWSGQNAVIRYSSRTVGSDETFRPSPRLDAIARNGADSAVKPVPGGALRALPSGTRRWLYVRQHMPEKLLGAADCFVQAAAVPGSSIPFQDQRLITRELSPALVVFSRELCDVVRSVRRVVAANEGEQCRAKRAPALEVERKGSAVTRPCRVSVARTVGLQKVAGAVSVAKDHQSPAFAQLDEAVRLPDHVDLVRSQPLHELYWWQPFRTYEPREVEGSERDAQRPAAVPAAGAAKMEGRKHGSTWGRRLAV